MSNRVTTADVRAWHLDRFGDGDPRGYGCEIAEKAWPAPGREVAVRERAAVIGAEVVAAVNDMVVRRLERRLAPGPPRPVALLEGGRGRV